MVSRICQDGRGRGLKVIIAGAGGAAHLPGMVASLTTLPVLEFPLNPRLYRGWTRAFGVQMPGGVPVGTLAIGDSGAKNAALLAIRVLGNECADLRAKLHEFAQQQTKNVLEDSEL